MHRRCSGGQAKRGRHPCGGDFPGMVQLSRTDSGEFPSMRTDVSEIIDLERYPIDGIRDGPGQVLAGQCRETYRETGMCLLEGFVRGSALEKLVAEVEGCLEHAFFCDGSHNAYLTDSPSRTDVPHLRQERTFVGSVPYDRLPRHGRLNALYLWDPLKDFIGFVLGKPEFHRFADPLGACSVNVFVEGGVHGWHFDESEYTVTLMLQAPESGGGFECVPLVRETESEHRTVSAVLDGDREHVVTLPFPPGALLIFGGRQSLHRVTPIVGKRPRLVPVLCYAEQSGMKNSESVRRLFWGRAGLEAGGIADSP